MVAGGRRAVRLEDDEVRDLLAEHLKVQVATVGPDGAPHLTTLFYVLDDAGRLAFWTYGASQKVANLRRDPRITCLVEDGEAYAELRGVSITGTATLVEGYDEVRALGARVTERLAGDAPTGDDGVRRLRDDVVAAQARKRVGVVVEPVRVASWDHRKLSALPGQG